jgi:hypothetical protein
MWLHLPTNKCILFIPRSGSTSIRTKIDALYIPEQKNPFSPRSFNIPEGFSAYALIRNPVDRFISGCAKTGKTPESALAMLNNFDERSEGKPPMTQNLVDVHFESLATRGLTDAVLPSVQLFKFETQIPEFCAAVEFDGLPHENESESRPTLTSEQEATVREYYARDISIWESI